MINIDQSYLDKDVHQQETKEKVNSLINKWEKKREDIERKIVEVGKLRDRINDDGDKYKDYTNSLARSLKSCENILNMAKGLKGMTERSLNSYNETTIDRYVAQLDKLTGTFEPKIKSILAKLDELVNPPVVQKKGEINETTEPRVEGDAVDQALSSLDLDFDSEIQGSSNKEKVLVSKETVDTRTDVEKLLDLKGDFAKLRDVGPLFDVLNNGLSAVPIQIANQLKTDGELDPAKVAKALSGEFGDLSATDLSRIEMVPNSTMVIYMKDGIPKISVVAPREGSNELAVESYFPMEETSTATEVAENNIKENVKEKVVNRPKYDVDFSQVPKKFVTTNEKGQQILDFDAMEEADMALGDAKDKKPKVDFNQAFSKDALDDIFTDTKDIKGTKDVDKT